MFAFEDQANEGSKDTNANKVGQSRMKIRIRLPPKRKLADGFKFMSKGVPQDSENLTAKNVPELTDNSTRSMTTAGLKADEASSNPPGVPKETKCLLAKEAPKQTDDNSRSTSSVASKEVVEEVNRNRSGEVLFKEANNNNQSETLARDTPPEKVNFIAPGRNPCENARNSTLSYRLFCETNSNMSSKGLSEDAITNFPSKNLMTSAMKCEGANDNPERTSLFEARKCMPTEKLPAGVPNNVPIRRPAVLANDKPFKKRQHSTVVHATDTFKTTSAMKLFPPAGQAVEQISNSANLEAIKIYEEFEEKVRRTVYLDNLSHLVTKAVIKTALDQFGTVRNVDFIINYTVPYVIPQSALVEMETEKDAESVVSMINEFPFMIFGMPRPVRGKRATATMFNDRPLKPGSKVEFRWVHPTDPDYKNVKELELMSMMHEVENLALIKLELEGEDLLAKQQQDNLNCIYRKFENLDTSTGRVDRLSHIYNM